ncbi:MAG: hypothetical protein ABF990_04715 [Acetobacter sp.]
MGTLPFILPGTVRRATGQCNGVETGTEIQDDGLLFYPARQSMAA